MDWPLMIGKTVAALRGFRCERFGKPYTPLHFVLFTDEKTFLELSEQDQYDFHDCNNSARVISICQDPVKWRKMFDKVEGFADVDEFDF